MLSSIRLYRPEEDAAYAHLGAVTTRPINWDLIAQQYDQRVKYATALRLGTAESESILRRLSWGSACVRGRGRVVKDTGAGRGGDVRGGELPMLLVTGPSGNVGAELVGLLGERAGGPWRVGSRHSDLLESGLGAEGQAVWLDFFDPASWSAALDGVDTLFLLFPLPSNKAARTGILPFLDAAERAGCRHVVYVSVFGADRAAFLPHYKVEQRLFASSMSWTVLRCSFFTQNLHRRVSTHGSDIAERGELFIPAGGGKTTFLDARDAAAVAADALLTPDQHRNRVHHLTGPEALTMQQVAAALTRHLHHPVRYTRPSLPRFAARLHRRGLGWDTIGFMAAVYMLTRLRQNQPITSEVEQLLGRAPHTVDDYLAHIAWRWHHQAWT